MPRGKKTPIVEKQDLLRFKLGKLPQEFQLGDKKVLTLTEKAYEGELCQLYSGRLRLPEVKTKVDPTKIRSRYDRILNGDSLESDLTLSVLAKICQDEVDNDLLEAEANVLSLLNPYSDKEANGFAKYFPKYFQSFLIGDCRVNLVENSAGYVPLSSVIKAYPKGIDFQDMAWMLNRALEGLGYVQNLEEPFVHGALLPQHILIHPTDHGAKIIDWAYSTKRLRILAICGEYTEYYPPEILERRDITLSTDLYMLAKCVVALLGGRVSTNKMPAKVPEPIQAMLLRCLDQNPANRPANAWALRDEFEEIMKGLVGKRKYRKFEI